MADSGSVRTQRYRLHRAGDHSLCRRPCGVQKPELALPPSRPLDAAQELRELAGRLVAAHEADPGNALLARELRLTLQALSGGKPADDDLESLFAELSAS